MDHLAGLKKFNPSRSDQGSEAVLGGLGAGWCLGEIRRLSRGFLGHAGGWPSQWGGVFVGVHRHHPVSRLGTLTISGDFADVDAVGGAFGAFVRLGVVLLCSEACA